jgi:hypothetical protein
MIMAVLTAAKRKRIPPGKFGIHDPRTGEGKYPMPDKAHARNAKARASQQLNAGNLSAEEKAKIDRKADAILNK